MIRVIKVFWNSFQSSKGHYFLVKLKVQSYESKISFDIVKHIITLCYIKWLWNCCSAYNPSSSISELCLEKLDDLLYYLNVNNTNDCLYISDYFNINFLKNHNQKETMKSLLWSYNHQNVLNAGRFNKINMIHR